jgi:LPXTG-motif cell wall-anchored protein
MKRTSIASVAVACALALPASAVAQSAGDNQYQDPLATPNSSQPKSSTPRSTSPAPSQGSSAGSGSGTAGTSTAPATPSATATTSGLPRTGADPAPLALIGLALLGGGLGLRRAARSAV